MQGSSTTNNVDDVSFFKRVYPAMHAALKIICEPKETHGIVEGTNGKSGKIFGWLYEGEERDEDSALGAGPRAGTCTRPRTQMSLQCEGFAPACAT